MLELVPGLLDGLVLADDPVVLPEPDIALFSFTAPLESRQWVAAETPDGLGEAPGVVLDGGELVCAPATRIPDARTNAAPNSLFDIAFSLDWRRDACEGRSNQLIARLLITIVLASKLQREAKNGSRFPDKFSKLATKDFNYQMTSEITAALSHPVRHSVRRTRNAERMFAAVVGASNGRR